jgi:hypothetical protein
MSSLAVLVALVPPNVLSPILVCAAIWHTGSPPSFDSSGMPSASWSFCLSYSPKFKSQLLSTLPPDLPPIKTVGHLPDLSHLRVDVETTLPSPQKRAKRTKGWDGESAATSSPEGGSASPAAQDTIGAGVGPAAHMQLERTYETVPAPDGSAAVHVVARCTLADLARATNLRVEDAAFALNECGLLVQRDGEGDAMTIAISREMVETVARERNVKRMCIDFTKVLL